MLFLSLFLSGNFHLALLIGAQTKEMATPQRLSRKRAGSPEGP